MSRLLEELNVEAQNLMALGDGENDVEMLQVSRAHSLSREGFITLPAALCFLHT